MRGWRIILILFALLLGSLNAFAIRAVHSGNSYTGDFGSTVSRARYYNPELGRFWTMDTFEGNNRDPLSLHRYAYCRANPVNRTDPSGKSDLMSMQLTMKQIAVISAIGLPSLTYAALWVNVTNFFAITDFPLLAS